MYRVHLPCLSHSSHSICEFLTAHTELKTHTIPRKENRKGEKNCSTNFRMAMVNAVSVAFRPTPSPSPSPSLLPSTSFSSFPSISPTKNYELLTFALAKRRDLSSPISAFKNKKVCDSVDTAEDKDDALEEPDETLLCSFSPLPLLFVASLPGASTVRSLFGPFVELVKSWNLPDWLVHWGHPGNMAVVLFAMGGYGTYLGFRIRFSDDLDEKAKAKDLHPKLLGGMFFFFALGATGGVTSLLTSDKPIFESPHAVTGFIGLSLLAIQTILPALFEGNPGLRNVHGILGSGIMTLFLVHAALGLQLGLSY